MLLATVLIPRRSKFAYDWIEVHKRLSEALRCLEALVLVSAILYHRICLLIFGQRQNRSHEVKTMLSALVLLLLLPFLLQISPQVSDLVIELLYFVVPHFAINNRQLIALYLGYEALPLVTLLPGLSWSIVITLAHGYDILIALYPERYGPLRRPRWDILVRWVLVLEMAVVRMFFVRMRRVPVLGWW